MKAKNVFKKNEIHKSFIPYLVDILVQLLNLIVLFIYKVEQSKVLVFYFNKPDTRKQK